MGLPMFREPEEIAADQAAAKLDQIAATRRSTIRRESTVRPGRITTSRQLLERLRHHREPSQEAEQRPSSFPSPISEREINDIDADLNRLRSMRQSRLARAALLQRELRARSNMDRIRPEPDARRDLDLDALTDAGMEVFLSDSEGNLTQHLPRPSRESGLRFEVAATSQSESEHPRRTRFHSHRPSRVPSSSAGRRSGAVGSPWSVRAGFDDGDDNDSENATLTPGFAPARGPFRPSPQVMDERRPTMADVNTLIGMMDTPPPEGLEATYPPLRRVNHISPRPLGVSGSRVDGLGDRLRSPSPSSDTHEEENWSNLLTTLEPGRSSAATSFLSSRSDSRSGSNRSSQTAATSFGEIGGDDSCDLDLPYGITADDVREIRASHGRLRRAPPLERHEPLAERVSRHGAGNDRRLELEVFGVILDRMQRREEIPDEWWAAVGLSPDVVRGRA
ncbi:hypothetical protein LTR72_006951 [Exophiala xenobiotica]|nr:hypothetical protein LTR72_006951 [Exophiala xenobiotica]KAK5287045.1 hypothetical protein LTR14_009462 [Exophiala xenobiotica]KAK5474932.1 hypothetical protein LTR55_009550 [Exophiala xenobiotica]